MTRLILALIAFLVLPPSLTAQSTVKPDTTYESYIANYVVNADGTFASTTESLLRLGTKEAIERSNPWRVLYNAELQSVEVIEAYTLKPDGKRVNVPASAIQTQLSPEAEAAPEFSSIKLQSVTFPDVKPGDGVYLKYRLSLRKTIFEGHFGLLEIFPVNSLWNSVEVNINAPPGYSLYWDAVDLEGGKLPDRDGRGRWQWKTRVTQTIGNEPGSTNITDYSPRLVVSSFPDYEALGAAYWAEAGKKVAVTPAIQQLADEITVGANETQQQARAIYEWVNKNIRYVAILIGRGTIIPHDASTILQNRYGDCKDYVTILHSLLAAKGIESIPVLVRADESFWFPKTPTIAFFNHAILYLPSLNVYLDATIPNTAFGLLPQIEIGKSALLAGRKTGKVFIPEGNPDENQIRSEIKLTVLDDGGMKVTSSAVFQGRMELVFRYVFADTQPEESNRALKAVMETFGLKGKGKFVEIGDSHRTGESFSIKAEFDLVDALKIPGPAGITIPHGLDLISVAEFGKLVELAQRKTSVLAGAFRITQQFHLTFPKSLSVDSIPPDISLENEVGHYKSNYKNENGVVTVTRDLLIKQDIVSLKEYPAFREVITKCVADTKSQIQYSATKGYKPAKIVAGSRTKTQSEGYVETYDMREVLGLMFEAEKLSRKKVLALESLLVKNPHDIKTRILLINHYSNITTTPAISQAYVRHRKWLIEKHPETEFDLDYNFFTRLSPSGPEYQALRSTWLRQVELKKDNTKVILNAALFLAGQDPQIAENLLQRGQQLEPDNYKWAGELGKLHASEASKKAGDEKTRSAALSIEHFEKALALIKKERSIQRDDDRISLLRRAADVAFDSEQMAKAKLFTTELVIEFGRDANRYSYAEIGHEGNIMLGKIALKERDIAKAKDYLLIAGRIVNLATRDRRPRFTPTMSLAKELFEVNERQAVLEYLELCEESWADRNNNIKKWTAMIRNGETPSFNLFEK